MTVPYSEPEPSEAQPFDPEDVLAAYAVRDRSAAHLRVNFIVSLDGAATHAGLSGPLNNAADKQVFDALRMLSDVVIVGAGTLRQEGYGALRVSEEAAAWRTAQGWPAHPRLAIVSSALGLSADSPIFTDAPVRPLILTHAHSPQEVRAALAEVADVVLCGEHAVDPHMLRAELTARGLPQMLSEGGPTVLGALVETDALDELCLTLSPVLEGGDAGRIVRGGAQRSLDMRLASTLTSGEVILLRYLRRR